MSEKQLDLIEHIREQERRACFKVLPFPATHLVGLRRYHVHKLLGKRTQPMVDRYAQTVLTSLHKKYLDAGMEPDAVEAEVLRYAQLLKKEFREARRACDSQD